jgi:hypothetical protein
MIYKAFLNRQEITGFPVNGVETDEIWGGDTLLWKKNDEIFTLSNTVGFGSPNSNTKYVTVNGYKVIGYGHHIEMSVTGSERKTSAYGNISNGILKYNIFVRSNSKPVITQNCIEAMLFSTEKLVQFEDMSVEFKKVEDNIYSLTGDYETLLTLSPKDDSGKLIGNTLTSGMGENYVYFGMYGFTINDAINYIKK